MPPGGGREAGAPEGLLGRVVDRGGLGGAAAVLRGAGGARRARSSLSCWLGSDGLAGAYDAAGADGKRGCLRQWCADSLGGRGGACVRSSGRGGGAAVETQRGKTFEWLSKEGVVNKHGEKKALSEIGSKKLEDRADPDTGDNTEWTK